MRISIDTNVFISYLIQPLADGAPTRVIRAVFEGRFDLNISETHLRELISTVHTKPYLSSRISDNDLEEFVVRLRLVATVVPDINERIPAITRDAGDDYLIVHAVTEQIEYLVSGDKDLLMLNDFEGLHIVSPSAFVEILDL